MRVFLLYISVCVCVARFIVTHAPLPLRESSLEAFDTSEQPWAFVFATTDFSDDHAVKIKAFTVLEFAQIMAALTQAQMVANPRTRQRTYVQLQEQCTRAWNSNPTHVGLNRVRGDLGLLAERGSTLVHLAAKAGNVPLLQQHISSQFDITFEDLYGRLALHDAAQHGHVECVTALCEHMTAHSLPAQSWPTVREAAWAHALARAGVGDGYGEPKSKQHEACVRALEACHGKQAYAS